MMRCNLIFRPLECRDAKLECVHWYRCKLLCENNEYIMGFTYGRDGNKLIYFNAVDSENGKETWNIVKNYKRLEKLENEENDFTINIEGKLFNINNWVSDLLL